MYIYTYNNNRKVNGFLDLQTNKHVITNFENITVSYYLYTLIRKHW